jgi:glycosyltransferase involved in cell wall biosynthesis
MKIAFYTQGSAFNGATLESRALGGSESALLYMARELASLGHAVKVFNNCDHPGFYDGVEYRMFDQVIPVTGPGPVDVCVLSRFYDPVQHINARKKILWLHDIARVKYYENAIPVLNRIVDKYFFINEWQMAGFLETYVIPQEMIYLTRNGIDPSLFGNNVKLNRNKLVYINTPFRGLDVLLEVFPLIRERIPAAELYLYTGMSLYGDGFSAMEQELEVIYRRARAQEGIILHPPLPKRKLAAELDSAYLSLYPCHFPECCSIASLESQAAGTPMITSDFAGLGNTIINGETGILIPFDDQQSRSRSPVYQRRFVEATVDLLMDDEKWEKFSHNARRLIAQRYTWNMIAREWEREFASLLNTV